MNALRLLKPDKDYQFLLADSKGVESFIEMCTKSKCLDEQKGLYVAHISGVYIKKEFGEIADLSGLKDLTVYAVIFTKTPGMPMIMYDEESGNYTYHLGTMPFGLVTVAIYEAKEVLRGCKVEFDSIRYF